MKIAESVGAKGTIVYQDEPLGTAHAILCAQEALNRPVVVAFADTLFKADFTLDSSACPAPSGCSTWTTPSPSAW